MGSLENTPWGSGVERRYNMKLLLWGTLQPVTGLKKSRILIKKTVPKFSSHIWMWELDHKESWAQNNSSDAGENNHFPDYFFYDSQGWQGSSVQLLRCVQIFATPWTAAHQASLSITNSWSLLKLMSIDSVMPSNRLILCCPLLLPPSIISSIRVFSSELVLCIRWPKY